MADNLGLAIAVGLNHALRNAPTVRARLPILSFPILAGCDIFFITKASP